MNVDEIDCNHLGERLTFLMVAKSMSQQELAAATGLSSSTISGYARGRHMPGLPALVALADALNVGVADLFAGTEGALPNVSDAVRAICKSPQLLSDDERLSLAEAIMAVKSTR